MRLVGLLGSVALLSGCGMVLDLGDPPAPHPEATDSTTADSILADTEVGDSSSTVDSDAAEDGVATLATTPGNVLLYRSTDGQALLVKVDASGLAVEPRTLDLGAGYGTLAASDNLLLGFDSSTRTARLMRLDRVGGTIVELAKQAYAYPFELSAGISPNKFLLQLTDYERANFLTVLTWDETKKSLITELFSDKVSPWKFVMQSWDDHLLLYVPSPFPDSTTFWGRYDIKSPNFIGSTSADVIGPFWEKVTAFGPGGVLAVRGASPIGRVISDMPAGAPKDVTGLPAPITLLGGTPSSKILVHQGDALTVGVLKPSGSGVAFDLLHRNDTGLVAKSWTSMVVFDDR